MALKIRLVFLAIFLVCASFGALSADRYPVASAAVMFGVLLEIYWIIPKLDESWHRKRQPFKNV